MEWGFVGYKRQLQNAGWWEFGFIFLFLFFCYLSLEYIYIWKVEMCIPVINLKMLKDDMVFFWRDIGL